MSILELINKLKEKIEELNEDFLLEEFQNIIEIERHKSQLFKIKDQ